MSREKNTSLKYLKAHSEILQGMGHQRGLSTWLLRHGRRFNVCHEWPESLPLQRGQLKECYRNCTLAATSSGGRFVYCEGYADAVMPVDHAWLLDVTTGVAYDPTWREGHSYFGVAFSTAWLVDLLLQRERYGVFYTETRVIIPDGLWKYKPATYSALKK